MTEKELPQVGMVAIAWFRPEEWDELKHICPDLQDTYQEWLANAEAGIEGMGPLKDRVLKVILTAADLRKFERSTGRKVDSKARAELAVRLASEGNQTRH